MRDRLQQHHEPIDAAAIASAAGVPESSIHGDARRSATHPASLHRGDRDAFSFCAAPMPAGAEHVRDSRCAIIFCRPDVAEALCGMLAERTMIAAPNPRLAFARAVADRFERPVVPGTHPSAIVDRAARIGERAAIGPYAVIDACDIGDDCVIAAHAHLLRGTRIGHRVTIMSGAILGSAGFGFERDESGATVRIPHLGGVTIEDDVEIGANACIDRGTLEDTIIRKGARIDDQVYVAHNADIGEHALIIAGAKLCGSCRIGARAWVAAGAVVRDKVRVGADALVGLGAVVVCDVPDAAVVMGVPARPRAD